MYMLNLPKKVYFKKSSMSVALKELDEVYGAKRAFIISDANLYTQGIVAPVYDFIRNRGISAAEYFSVDAEPTFENVRAGLPKMLNFQPDFIVAVGGGSVMSVAKAMWLLYENPDLDLNEVAQKFNSLTVDRAAFPTVGVKAKLALVATTTGTGAECSPFAVLTNDAGEKCVIANYSLIPELAVIDADYSDSMPAELTKKCGLSALSLAARAYVAAYESEYTQAVAREAAEAVLNNLADALVEGSKRPNAIIKLSYAGALAGMAYSNAADTLDVNAGVYPTEAEKVKSDLIVTLAKAVGIEGDSDDEIFANWIAACEALAAL